MRKLLNKSEATSADARPTRWAFAFALCALPLVASAEQLPTSTVACPLQYHMGLATAPITHTGPFSVSDPAIVDLNRDGRGDIAALATSQRKLMVRLQTADYDFGPPQVVTYHSGNSWIPAGTVLAPLDLEGDGDMDLVGYEIETRRLNTFLNTGNGIFANGPHFPISGHRSGNQDWKAALKMIDYNRDGKMDLALVSGQLNDVLVFRNDSGHKGVQLTEAQRVSLRSGDLVPQLSDLAVGDLNNDGNADMAVALTDFVNPQGGGGYGGRIVRLYGTSNGSYAVDWGSVEPVLSPLAVRIADLDRDGRRDIVAQSLLRLGVLRNESGQFIPYFTAQELPTATGLVFEGLEVADMNGDLYPDIVESHLFPTGAVQVRINSGQGAQFVPSVQRVLGSQPLGFALGRVDRDGRRDLMMVRTWGPHYLEFFQNTSTATPLCPE